MCKKLIKDIVKKDLTPEKMVPVLREVSVHPDARLCFKSAGLIYSDEFEVLKFMMSQADKFLEKVLKTESGQGQVANERREMFNSFFTKVFSNPSPSQPRIEHVCPNPMPKISVSKAGVLNLLLKIKENKATGPDGIPGNLQDLCE